VSRGLPLRNVAAQLAGDHQLSAPIVGKGRVGRDRILRPGMD
jgi:hypothetical protein